MKLPHSFNAGIENWSSSNKAETISTLTTLLVVHSNSNVIIYTDSKTSIDCLDFSKTTLMVVDPYYDEQKITFLDLINGIIPRSLTNNIYKTRLQL
ncbi:14254_t:CDS:2 [Entrophospora sp. SA101]|nr:14254_t:CDS:2 [Entrophospora sp. SA101]